MLNGLVKFMIAKSVGTDLVKVAVRNSRNNEDVLKEKLGVSSIDEFMKMDFQKNK